MIVRRSRAAVRAAAAGLLTASLLLFPWTARAADAPGITHYGLDPAKSSLEFTFMQAGAANKGHFKRFQVAFDFSAENLAASKLDPKLVDAARHARKVPAGTFCRESDQPYRHGLRSRR